MNLLRWLLIATANLVPSKILRRTATHICNIIPSYPEEEGAFRSDIALCAFGLLRYGDINGFEYWLARYPFPRRWTSGYYRLLCVDFIQGKWYVFGLNARRNFGKAQLIACPHDHFAVRSISQ